MSSSDLADCFEYFKASDKLLGFVKQSEPQKYIKKPAKSLELMFQWVFSNKYDFSEFLPL